MATDRKEYDRRYRERHRERIRQQSREYYSRHKERLLPQYLQYRSDNHDKRTAQRKIAYLLHEGWLQRRPCEQCGALAVDAHHEDYSKPLNVTWLCRSCHKQHHKKQKEV